MYERTSELEKKLVSDDREVIAEALSHLLPHLIKLAHRQIWGAPQIRDEAEDAVQSAVATFWRRWREGQFRDCDDLGKIYALLCTIVRRKVLKSLRKRRKQLDEAALGPRLDEEGAHSLLEELSAVVPSHEFDLWSKELLTTLPDDKHRRILCMLVEGAAQAEIAEKLGCTARNVRYKIDRIRDIWSRRFADVP